MAIAPRPFEFPDFDKSKGWNISWHYEASKDGWNAFRFEHGILGNIESILHFVIQKRGDKFVVLDSDGKKVLGEHDTEEQAKAQLRAIEASKERDNDMEFSEVIEKILEFVLNLQVMMAIICT